MLEEAVDGEARGEQQQSKRNRFLSGGNQQEEQENERPEQDSDAEANEEDDEDSALLSPSALVVAGRRDRLAGDSLLLDGDKHRRFTVVPSVGTASGSEAEGERSAAGLFVDRSEATAVRRSRIEERLRREAPLAADALLAVTTSQPIRPNRTAVIEPESDTRDVQDDGHGEPAPRLAWLQVEVSRAELDDHAAFSRRDRVAAQLRASCAAYAACQRARAWGPPLARLDAHVVELAGRPRAAPKAPTAPKALAGDAARALAALEHAQQLHAEVLARARELQALAAHSGDGGFAPPVAVVERRRAAPVDLAPVRALLELLASSADADAGAGADAETIARLARQLRALAPPCSACDAVLELRPQAAAPSAEDPRGPRLYVAVYVDGRLAARTRARRCAAGGGVRWDERFRLRLDRLPAVVAARVLERRRVLRDVPLAPTPVPLVVPGLDLAQQRPEGAAGAAGAARIAAASVAPTREWYQFSAAAPLPRARWHATFRDAALPVERRAQGRVAIALSWVAASSGAGPGPSPAALLPLPRAPLARMAPSAARVVGAGGAHALIKHALARCVAGERIDPNDPANAAAAAGRRRAAPKTSAAVFRAAPEALGDVLAPLGLGGSSAAPFPTRLTKRNELLARRGREPEAAAALAGAAMPLLERELLAREPLVRLLRPELRALDRALAREQLEAIGADQRVARRSQRVHMQLRELEDRARGAVAGDGGQRGAASAKPPLALANIIQEKPLPLFPGALELPALGALLARRRRLRPAFRPQVATAAALTAAERPARCDLYVQVLRATRVPLRVRSAAASSAAAPSAAQSPLTPRRLRRQKEGTRRLTPRDTDLDVHSDSMEDGESLVLVEARLQGRTRRTACSTATAASGGAAHWMETLTLPVRAPGDDWSCAALARARDVVRLRLLDRALLPTAAADGRGFKEELRELASVDVPLAALLGGVFDAALRCSAPIERLGYSHFKPQQHGPMTAATSTSASQGDATPRSDPHETHNEPSDGCSTFLSVRMTLRPVLPLPDRPPLSPPSTATDNELVVTASQWAERLQRQLPGRGFDAVVARVVGFQGGHCAVLPQLLAALPPPPAIATVAGLLRFVHLLPLRCDWLGAPDQAEAPEDPVAGTWVAPQLCLDVGAAGRRDLALLLACLLLWLDQHGDDSCDTFLVLGRGVTTDGDATQPNAFVLRQPKDRRRGLGTLYDAAEGAAYAVTGEQSPLRDAWLAVSAREAFANVQPPNAHVDWAIQGNASRWTPMLGKTPPRMPSLLPRELRYAATPPDDELAAVERELREAVKLAVRRWRATFATTVFNEGASLRLRARLETLDRRARGEAEPKDEAAKAREGDAVNLIRSLERDKGVAGAPLHFALTDAAHVVERVKQTNVHATDRAGVEFLLAIHASGYPGALLSVWVYLAAAWPRDG